MARRGVVVGFYKDHGKTKPITRSNAKLNQKKNIVNPHKFHGVEPGKSKVDVTQLENVLEKLAILENQKQDLFMQKQVLEKAGKNTGAVDHQLSIQERMILRQKLLIKGLGKEHG
jgi:hypothetical protein